MSGECKSQKGGCGEGEEKGKRTERERVSVWAEMSGCCLAGVEQNFGEDGGEVGRGWAEQWACLGGRKGQSPKMRGD